MRGPTSYLRAASSRRPFVLSLSLSLSLFDAGERLDGIDEDALLLLRREEDLLSVGAERSVLLA